MIRLTHQQRIDIVLSRAGGESYRAIGKRLGFSNPAIVQAVTYALDGRWLAEVDSNELRLALAKLRRERAKNAKRRAKVMERLERFEAGVRPR